METSPESNHFKQEPTRAWYGATIAEFLQTNPDIILGRLARNSDFTVLATQMDAWLVQIGLLRAQPIGLKGSIFLEFNIPRMGRRIDAVLLIGSVVFVIEFKVGESTFERSAIDQVWDYALDLKNFHEASHSVWIVPILIVTGATSSSPSTPHLDEDKVYRPILLHPAAFREAIDKILRSVTGDLLDEDRWPRAIYHPTPTIVEAARRCMLNIRLKP